MSTVVSRRTFFRDGVLLVAGAVGGTALPLLFRRDSQALGQAKTTSSGAEQRLIDLGIELPAPPKPVAVYVPTVQTGNLLFVSGHGTDQPDGTRIVGKVGADLTLEQGHAAARQVGLNVLASVRKALGSLDHVVRVVKVLGMVNATADFKDHPKVINGFSELMVQVFGEESGKAARSAVGMGSLPSNIAVEVEAIFEVRARVRAL